MKNFSKKSNSLLFFRTSTLFSLRILLIFSIDYPTTSLKASHSLIKWYYVPNFPSHNGHSSYIRFSCQFFRQILLLTINLIYEVSLLSTSRILANMFLMLYWELSISLLNNSSFLSHLSYSFRFSSNFSLFFWSTFSLSFFIKVLCIVHVSSLVSFYWSSYAFSINPQN